MSKNFDVRTVKELAREVKQNYVAQVEIAKQEKGEELSFSEKVELRQVITENVEKQKFPQRMELVSPIEELSNLIFCICQRSTVNRKPIYYACIEEKPVAFIFWSGKRWVLDDDEDLQAPYRAILNDDPFSPVGEYVAEFEGQKIPFTLQETDKESECSVEPVGAYPKSIRIVADFQGSGAGDGEEQGFGTLTRSDIIAQSIEGLPETINGVPYYGGFDESQGNIFLYFGEEGWTFDNDTEEPGFFGISGNKLRILGAYQVIFSGIVIFTITESESGTLPEDVNLVSSLPMEPQIEYTWMGEKQKTKSVYFSGQLQEGTQIYFDKDLNRPFNIDSEPVFTSVFGDTGKPLYRLDMETGLTARLSSQQVIFNPETGLLSGNKIGMTLDESGIVTSVSILSEVRPQAELSVGIDLTTSYQLNSITYANTASMSVSSMIFNMNLNNVRISNWGEAFEGIVMPSYVNLSNISLQVSEFSSGMGWSAQLSLGNSIIFPPVWEANVQTMNTIEESTAIASTILNVLIEGQLRSFNIDSINLNVSSNNSIDTSPMALFPQSGIFSNISGSILISSNQRIMPPIVI